jgi:hypothetical protein
MDDGCQVTGSPNEPSTRSIHLRGVSTARAMIRGTAGTKMCYTLSTRQSHNQHSPVQSNCVLTITSAPAVLAMPPESKQVILLADRHYKA